MKGGHNEPEPYRREKWPGMGVLSSVVGRSRSEAAWCHCQSKTGWGHSQEEKNDNRRSAVYRRVNTCILSKYIYIKYKHIKEFSLEKGTMNMERKKKLEETLWCWIKININMYVCIYTFPPSLPPSLPKSGKDDIPIVMSTPNTQTLILNTILH